MDCRITNCRVAISKENIVSVPPDHDGIAGRQDCYYGLVKKIIQNDKGHNCHGLKITQFQSKMLFC